MSEVLLKCETQSNAADLCREIGKEGNVHLLALNCEILVQTVRRAFWVVDGGLIVLQKIRQQKNGTEEEKDKPQIGENVSLRENDVTGL